MYKILCFNPVAKNDIRLFSYVAEDFIKMMQYLRRLA